MVLTAKSRDGAERSIELTVVSEEMITGICIGGGAICLIITGGVIYSIKKKKERE